MTMDGFASEQHTKENQAAAAAGANKASFPCMHLQKLCVLPLPALPQRSLKALGGVWGHVVTLRPLELPCVELQGSTFRLGKQAADTLHWTDRGLSGSI